QELRCFAHFSFYVSLASRFWAALHPVGPASSLKSRPAPSPKRSRLRGAMCRCRLALLYSLPALCLSHTLHSSLPPDDAERGLPVMRRESKDAAAAQGFVQVDPVEEVQDQLHEATEAAQSAAATAATAQEAAREAVVAAAAPATTPSTTAPKASDAFSPESLDKPYRSSVVVNVPAKTTPTTTTTQPPGTTATTVNIAQMVAAAKAAAEEARDAAAAAAKRASAANASIPRGKEGHPSDTLPEGHPANLPASSTAHPTAQSAAGTAGSDLAQLSSC
ncbi:unnamed protein product, partial [Symbiodinium natans]